MGAAEQGGQVGLESGLQKIGCHMQVARLAQQVVGDMPAPQGRHQPGVGQDRAVSILIQDHAHASLPIRTDDDMADIHVPFFHFIEHEVSEEIITADSNKAHPQPQPRRAAGKDRRR